MCGVEAQYLSESLTTSMSLGGVQCGVEDQMEFERLLWDGARSPLISSVLGRRVESTLHGST